VIPVVSPPLVPSAAIPVTPSNRSRTRKTKPGDSLANIPHAPSALSVSTYRSQLSSLMDRLLDLSVTVEKFSEQVGQRTSYPAIEAWMKRLESETAYLTVA
jgi:hypothetical protein